MSAPRRLLKGQSYVCTRRTVGRTFFLVPTKDTVEIVRYALLLSASRAQREHGLETSAYSLISNHHHALNYDPRGGPKSGMPSFYRDLHMLIARAMNAKLDRGGHFWAQGSYRSVEVHEFEAEIAQYCYVLCQPVAAGLVRRPEQWPGTFWLPEDHGKAITARRPQHAFFGAISRLKGEAQRTELLALLHAQQVREASQAEGDVKRGRSRQRRRRLARDRAARAKQEREELVDARTKPQRSTLPDEVSYTIPFPRCVQGWDPDEARRFLRAALEAYLANLHAEREAEGLRYLGLQRALRVNPESSAGSDCPTFGRIPQVSARGLPLGQQLDLLDGLVRFRGDHAEGVEILLQSDTPWRARFPAGAHARAKELRRVLVALAQPPPRRA